MGVRGGGRGFESEGAVECTRSADFAPGGSSTQPIQGGLLGTGTSPRGCSRGILGTRAALPAKVLARSLLHGCGMKTSCLPPLIVSLALVAGCKAKSEDARSEDLAPSVPVAEATVRQAPVPAAPPVAKTGSPVRQEIASDECVFAFEAPTITRVGNDVLPPGTEAFTLERDGKRVMSFIAHSRSGVESLADLKSRTAAMAVQGQAGKAKTEKVRVVDQVYAATEGGTSIVVNVATPASFAPPSHHVSCEGNAESPKTDHAKNDGCHFIAWGSAASADEVAAICKSVRIRREPAAPDAATKAAARSAREGDSRELFKLLY